MSSESTPVPPRHNLAERVPDTGAWALLIAETAHGSDTGLAALYDATSTMVHGLALRILGDVGAAEEVTADVYMQVWRQAERYDPERGAPLTWLLTLARSRAIDRLRSGAQDARRAAPIGEAMGMSSPTPGPEECSEVDERRRLVRQALERLVPEQRRVLELSYFGGLSHSEVAAALGEPLGTVKTRIRLGMGRMREALACTVGAPL